MGKRVGITYSIPEKLKPYADALKLVGLDPVPLRAGEAVSLDSLDGLLISGGCDLNPRRYGQERSHRAEPGIDPLQCRGWTGARKRLLRCVGTRRGVAGTRRHRPRSAF